MIIAALHRPLELTSRFFQGKPASHVGQLWGQQGATKKELPHNVPLTDTAVRAAKPQVKARKLFDGGGLYLEISPAGGKWWRWKYRFGGKEKRISLGVLGVFPLLKHPLPVVVAFLLPATDTLDHRRVGNGTHRHGLLQEPMEELPAMA